MATKLVSEQLISKSALSSLASADAELDNILSSINSQATPPLYMSENGGDRVLNISALSAANPETSRNKSINPINNALPTFASGTVTLDATGAGNATPSVGSAIALGMSASQYLKIMIFLDQNGNLLLSAGNAGASLAAATLPTTIPNTFALGYLVARTDGSNNVQNILGSDIYQFTGGGGAGGSSGSGVGEINYIENSDFETDTSGMNLYADAAGSEPVDGTGGSANVTISAQDTVVLRDDKSLKLAKDAVNRQGEGFSTDFTIKDQDKSKKLKIQFDFKTDEDAGYASGDLKVFIYDVTNSTLITPVDTDIIRGVGVFQTSFNSTTSTSYRLIFHIATTNATAWDAYLDRIIVGNGVISQGAVVGPWSAWTPTLNSTHARGTNTELSYWRRVGDSMEIFYTYLQTAAGTNGTGAIQYSLPSGYTIDTTQISLNNSRLGSAYVYDGTNEYNGFVHASTTTSFTVLVHTSATVAATAQSVAPLSDTTVRVHCKITLPISEWAGGSGIIPMLSEDNLSEWQSYTPAGLTGGEWGTSTNINLQYRRVGDSIQIRGEFTSGTCTANEGQIDLPPGLTIGGTNAGTTLAGSFATAATYSSASVIFYLLATPGDTYLNFSRMLSTTNTSTLDAITADNANSIRISIDSGLIPIQEWSGSQNSLVGYSLYNPDVQTGLVDSRGVKGHSNGAAIAEGYVGEKKISYTTIQLVAATYKTVGTLNLTAGVWLLKGTSIQSDFTASRFYVGVFSTSIDTGGSVTDGTASPKATDYDSSTGGGGVTHIHTLNLSSDQTWYFNVYVSAINGANNCYNYYEAIRIA